MGSQGFVFEHCPVFCYHGQGMSKEVNMNPFIASSLILLVLGMANPLSSGENTMSFQNLDLFVAGLPETIGNWRKAPSVRYDPSTLSDYIDGAAELYISYRFIAALSTRYGNDKNQEITVDIFDMGSAEDAYGVFSHGRESSDKRFGQGSEYSSGLLTFWKDRYYVSVLAYPAAKETETRLFELADKIVDMIPQEGDIPAIVSLLPDEDLIEASIRYFTHYIWLNSFFYVSGDDVFNIGTATPAVMGRYRLQGGSAILLIVVYPNAQAATAASARFQNHLASEKRDSSPISKRFWGQRKRNNILLTVLKAESERDVATLLDRTDRNLEEQNVKKRN